MFTLRKGWVPSSWRNHPRSLAASATALALALTGCSSQDPAGTELAGSCPEEVTAEFDGDTITVGSSAPLSGPVSFAASAATAGRAFLDHINEAEGGVETANGLKKVEMTILDDAYTPSRMQQNARELVEGEEVDLLAQTVGTSGSLALADYVNDNCVPLLWPVAGTSALATTPDSPFTSSFFSYDDQGSAVGSYLVENRPDATVAVLYQNDDTGLSGFNAFKEAIEGSGVEVVAEQSYESTDTSVSAQMATLAASDADVFFPWATVPRCTQALADLETTSWRPTIYGNEVCNDQAISSASPSVLEDVYLPRWIAEITSDSPAATTFRRVMEESGLDVNTTSAQGWIFGQAVAVTLENAESLSRQGVMDAAVEPFQLNPDYSLLLPGIELSAAGGAPAVRSYVLVKWDTGAEAFAEEGTVVVLE